MINLLKLFQKQNKYWGVWRRKYVALFKNKSVEEIENIFADRNLYLDNPEKGIELIKKMIRRRQRKQIRSEVDNLIINKIFPILAELELENELEIYKTLTKISNKMKEQQKIELLEGKKVLGIGGQFSAGKSCFINSITNANLPEGQRPTTSIATYIVNAEAKKNVAISVYDNVIDLDDEAMSAITHQFFETYQIGFSRLIKNLVVYTPNFTYPNIAVLDTPGYTKADSSKQDDKKDRGIAREQLNTVDYLIWLIDPEKGGGIDESDLNFISSLNVESEILVVITKASLKTEDDLKKLIQSAKDKLREFSDKEIYDVIAYDSFKKETVIGEGVLEQFLQKINNNNDSQKITEQIYDIRKQLECQISKQRKEINDRIKKLDKILVQTSNIEHISALVKEYSRCKSMLISLDRDNKRISSSFRRLKSFVI